MGEDFVVALSTIFKLTEVAFSKSLTPVSWFPISHENRAGLGCKVSAGAFAGSWLTLDSAANEEQTVSIFCKTKLGDGFEESEFKQGSDCWIKLENHEVPFLLYNKM